MTPTDDASDDRTRTRRSILGTTATLGALGLAGCSGGSGGGGSGTDTATDTATDGMTSTTATDTEASMAAPDVPLLNYALTLEHLENAFYRDGLAAFSDDELMNADALSSFSSHVTEQVPGHFQTVGAHEAAHVDAISQTVSDLGGTPVEEAEYDFGYETPSEFLGVARALENTGVAAYKGAAPTVSNDAVFSASTASRRATPRS